MFFLINVKELFNFEMQLCSHTLYKNKYLTLSEYHYINLFVNFIFYGKSEWSFII